MSPVEAIVCAVIIPLFFGMLLKTLRNHLNVDNRRPPLTVTLFFMGILVSFCAEYDFLGILGESVRSIQKIEPFVISAILLPPMVFFATSQLNYHVFSKVMWQAMWLGMVGSILFILLLTAFLCTVFSGQFSWDFKCNAMLLSIILSNTDPTPVITGLEKIGAHEHISSLLETEGLFNDATSFVLFLTIQQIASEDISSAWGIFREICGSAIFAPLLGVITALIVALWLYYVYHDPLLETVTVGFFVFLLSCVTEIFMEISAVVAVGIFGLFMSWRGNYFHTPEGFLFSRIIVEFMRLIGVVLIFVYSGIVSFSGLYDSPEMLLEPANWLRLIILYLSIHAIRALVLLFSYPIIHGWGYTISRNEALFSVFSGSVRGTGGLVFSMLLQLKTGIPEETRHCISFYTVGICVLTMLINGTCSSFLYKHLGLQKNNPYHAVLFSKAMSDLENIRMVHVLKMCGNDWLYQNADFSLGQRLIPDLTKATLRGETVDLTGIKLEPITQIFDLDDHFEEKNSFARKFSNSDEALKIESFAANEGISRKSSAYSVLDDIVSDQGCSFETLLSPLPSNFTAEDKEKQQSECIFRKVRAAYHAQYEACQLGESTVGELTRASFVGSETQCLENNFLEKMKAEWAYLCALTTTPVSNFMSSCVQLPFIGSIVMVYVFRSIFISIEALSAYWRAHQKAYEMCVKEFPNSGACDIIEDFLTNCESKLSELRIKHRRAFIIAQTVLTARFIVHEKKEILETLLKEGILEKIEVECLVNCLEKTQNELQCIRATRSIAEYALRKETLVPNQSGAGYERLLG